LMEADLDTEGGRFAARHAICAVLEPWFASRTLAEIRTALDGSGVLWGPYQDFGQLVHEDPRCSLKNPIFATIDQPGVGQIMANTAPLGFSVDGRVPPQPAPRLGEDTEAVLSEILLISSLEYGRLRDQKLVA